MHRTLCPAAAGLTLILLLTVGCSSEPRTYPVSGTVTWNGEPMPKGNILFEDPEGKIPADANTIHNGKFSLGVKAGKKRIQIRADREIKGAKIDPAMGAIPREQYVPTRYNDQSKLEEVVRPEGPNQFEFKLTDKP